MEIIFFTLPDEVIQSELFFLEASIEIRINTFYWSVFQLV